MEKKKTNNIEIKEKPTALDTPIQVINIVSGHATDERNSPSVRDGNSFQSPIEGECGGVKKEC